MRSMAVVQQGLRTPTIPSFGSCYIRGIHGPACGSAFMRQLRGRAVLSFAASACAEVRLAVEPHTDLSALVMLGVLLRDVRNKRSTALDAADSSVSPLPGDQNRGETHATPEQTEVGTPLRAAANRPVRRERAGHRRHAGVVRTTDGNTGS